MSMLLNGSTIASIPAWAFWLIILIVAGIIEINTINMVSIWFALGALVALLLDLIGINLTTQVVVFFIVSLLGFIAFILLVKPRFTSEGTGIIPTNADRILGQKAIVIYRISPMENVGQIHVLGQIWSARSHDGSMIETDTLVEVVDISGVHAIVKPLIGTEE
ncbi:MAG TPA: NfeD family protein [Clostridiaceae bacterium]|nr:NfeD family protein [Clostridiaceae bacterium]